MIGPLQLLMEQAVNWLPTVPHTVDTPCGTFDGCSVDFEKVRCRGIVLFSAAIEHVSALVRRVPSATWQMAGGGCTNRTCRGSFRARVPPGRPVVGLRQALPSMCAVPQVVNAGKIGKILIQRDEETHQCAGWLLGLCERRIAQPFRTFGSAGSGPNFSTPSCRMTSPRALFSYSIR
jgi:uracil phosphoribosyltransferase